jgi:hypothetical protein
MFSLFKIYVKLQITNPIHEQIKFVQNSIKSSLKLHQKLFFLNKSIANQPNWFKSTKFEAMAWNQLCLGSFMEILE